MATLGAVAGRRSFLERKFCDDFRGGGLGRGGGIATPEICSFLVPRSASLTVELDEEDVVDSRTAASPRGSLTADSGSFVRLPVRRRVTGGRLRVGLACRALSDAAKRLGAMIPGDWDEMDVGVVSRLIAKGPGDSENLVDGLALTWLLLPEKRAFGVGGGKS